MRIPLPRTTAIFIRIIDPYSRFAAPPDAVDPSGNGSSDSGNGENGASNNLWSNTASQAPSPTSSNVAPSQSTTSGAISSPKAKSNSNSHGNGGLRTNTKIAIAIPVAVGGAALIAALVFLVFYMRRRKQRRAAGEAHTPVNSQVHIPKGHAHGQATPRMEMATATAPVPAAPNDNNWTMPSQTHNLQPPFDGPLPQQHNSTPVLPETYRSSDPGMGIGLALTPEHPVPSPSPPSAGVGAEFPRARSPFNHPDDTLSDISRVSGRRRGVDGDGGGDADADADRASVISSVSSIDAHEHEHGHGNRGFDGH